VSEAAIAAISGLIPTMFMTLVRAYNLTRALLVWSVRDEAAVDRQRNANDQARGGTT
jgi:hypothetical protein